MDPSVQKEVAVVEADIKTISKKVAGSIIIKNDKDLAAATDVLGKVQELSKAVEKKKRAIIDPINLSLREIRELFKPQEDKLSAAKLDLKKSILDYQEKLEKAAVKKSAKLEKEFEDGNVDWATANQKMSKVKQAPGSLNTGGGSFQTRRLKKIRIVNPALLPVKYFLRQSVIDALTKEVSKDVLKNHEPVPEGAEQYEEKSVAAGVAK